MREFSEYLLVLDPAFIIPKEHQASSRDIIGGVEILVLDILIFLDKDVSFFWESVGY